MEWINARRTAVLAGLAALIAVVAPAFAPSAEGVATPLTVALIIGAVVAALSAYASAYQADGLLAKLALSVLVSALSSVASGLTLGLDVGAIVVTTSSVVVGQLLAQSRLPSTEGSASDEGVLTPIPVTLVDDSPTLGLAAGLERHGVPPAAPSWREELQPPRPDGSPYAG